jgi:hypothetical protein
MSKKALAGAVVIAAGSVIGVSACSSGSSGPAPQADVTASQATGNASAVTHILVGKLRKAWPQSRYEWTPVALDEVGIASAEVDLLPNQSGDGQQTFIFAGNPQAAGEPDSADAVITGTTSGVRWAVKTIGYTDGTFDFKPSAIARVLGGTEQH